MGSCVHRAGLCVNRMGLELAHFSNFAQGAATVAGAVSTAYDVGKKICGFAQAAAPVVAAAAALL